MRRMFVEDGFKPIFEAKEDKKANIFSKASIFFTKNVVRGLRKVDNVLVESNAFMSVGRLEFDDEFDMTPDEVRCELCAPRACGRQIAVVLHSLRTLCRTRCSSQH